MPKTDQNKSKETLDTIAQVIRDHKEGNSFNLVVSIDEIENALVECGYKFTYSEVMDANPFTVQEIGHREYALCQDVGDLRQSLMCTYAESHSDARHRMSERVSQMILEAPSS